MRSTKLFLFLLSSTVYPFYDYFTTNEFSKRLILLFLQIMKKSIKTNVFVFVVFFINLLLLYILLNWEILWKLNYGRRINFRILPSFSFCSKKDCWSKKELEKIYEYLNLLNRDDHMLIDY